LPAPPAVRRTSEAMRSARTAGPSWAARWRQLRPTVSLLSPRRADDLFKGAAGLFRELAVPFYMAVTQLEHGEWLAGEGRSPEAEPLLAEAREIFERLEAGPWVERAARAAGVEQQTEAVV
jgi:hypothetical protein